MTMSAKRIFSGEARVPVEWRRVGYAVAIAINLLLLVIVVNLLEWGWLSFLTEDFETLVPIAVFSLVLSMAFYAVYMFYDAGWLRLLGDIITGAVAWVVVYRTLTVFPFDFETGPWSTMTRAILIFITLGITIGLIANIVKLARGDFEGT